MYCRRRCARSSAPPSPPGTTWHNVPLVHMHEQVWAAFQHNSLGSRPPEPHSSSRAHGLHSNRLALFTSDPAHPSRAVAHGGPPVSQVDSPLRMMDNVLLAPHNSNSSPTAHENVQVPTAQLTSPRSCNSVSALQPPARCLLPPARCPACYSSSCSRFFLLLLPRLLPRILLFPPGPASSPAGS